MSLPKGWKAVKIYDVIGGDGIFCDGDWIESKDQDKNGEVRLIQLADVGDGYFRNKSDRYLTYAKATELNCTFLNYGDILVARMPDPLGRSCIFPLKGKNRYVTVVDIAIIRCDETICDRNFFNYLINSPQIRNAINELESGTTRKRISRKNLSILDFPLPLIHEQKKVVAKIEELFSELEKGKDQLETALKQLSIFRQSILKWAYEGKLTHKNVKEGELPKLWELTKLKEIAHVVDPQPSHRTPPSFEGGVPFVSIKDFDYEKNNISFSKARRVHQNVLDEHIERYQLEKHDFVIGKIGTIGNPVKVALPQNYALSANVVLIQPRKVNPNFLFYFFKTNHIEKEFKKGAKATTQAAFGIQKVRELMIPVPTVEEQVVIVDEIENRLSVIDALSDTIIKNLRQVETLKQSILKKAFEGKLL